MLVGGFVSATAPLRAQTIVFVDGDATGPVHDGTSWCSAYTDLQDALTEATAGTEIRVADGTYKPGLTRLSTFRLKTGVAILGGFAGCGAPDPGLRDLALYESVLSGDLDGNDVEAPESECCREHAAPGCEQETCQQDVCAERAICCSDQWDRLCAALAAIHCCLECGSRCQNAYHVVSGSSFPSTDETAVLDGFTITGGFANGGNPSDRGAGIFNTLFPSSPIIRNCRIRGNVALSKGAGVSNENSSATYINCAIYGNIAPLGAGMYNNVSSPSLVNSTVTGNTAQTNAGGIWNILFEDDHVTLVNTLLWNNADDGGLDESAQMNIGIGNVTVDYSTIQGCTGLFGGIGNTGLDPLFADAAGADGTLGTSDDDLTLTLGSPSINTGDPATEVGNGAVDLSGRPRLAGCRVDRGAYESDESQAAFDFDADASITLADYASLQVCFDATRLEPAHQDVCLCVFDADAGDSVDLDDFAAFAAFLNGP